MRVRGQGTRPSKHSQRRGRQLGERRPKHEAAYLGQVASPVHKARGGDARWSPRALLQTGSNAGWEATPLKAGIASPPIRRAYRNYIKWLALSYLRGHDEVGGKQAKHRQRPGINGQELSPTLFLQDT